MYTNTSDIDSSIILTVMIVIDIIVIGIIIIYKFTSVPPREDRKKKLKKDLVVLDGNDISLPVYFEGFPTPSVTWTLNKMNLSESGRTAIVKREDFTKITINRGKSSDAGTYKVVLSNSVGKTEISCRVSIQGNGLPGYHFIYPHLGNQ